MKRVRSIIMLGVIILPLLAKADVVWSGIKNDRLFPFSSFDLDINADGESDFLFNCPGSLEYRFAPLYGNAGLSFLGQTYDPITTETFIGPGGSTWIDEERVLLDFVGAEDDGLFGFGPFFDTNAYIGVSFQFADATHYGWIHLTHENDAPPDVSAHLFIQDWAWETQAGTGIVAGAVPEPTTGVLTMIGSFSLLAVVRARRRGTWRFSTVPKGRSRRSADPTHW